MHTFFLVLIIAAVAAQALALILFFFEPALAFRVRKTPAVPSDKDEFSLMIESVSGSVLEEGNHAEILKNGEVFYEEEIKAMSQARHHIHIEAYIFYKGKVTARVLEILTERARSGVQVRLVLDALGCLFVNNGYFKNLREAGGRVEWYNPFRWYLLPKFNHRTHREIVIIDGTIAFVGGAGFGDHWMYGTKKEKRWRDSMFRLHGPVVRGLQAVFSENWLEASGEIVIGKEFFPPSKNEGPAIAMAVGSTASLGRSTRARMMFQALIASARHSIYVTTPYFVPDRGARKEILRAVQERGVQVKVITPGKKSDHPGVRRSSRKLWGPLLQAGVVIGEYLPTMIHTKTMVIDEEWSVIGSTNFDHRSFGLNNEVNVVLCDEEFTSRLCEVFAEDLAESRIMTFDHWKKRPVLDKFRELFGWVLERQQ